jgi:hypothetical protein
MAAMRTAVAMAILVWTIGAGAQAQARPQEPAEQRPGSERGQVDPQGQCGWIAKERPELAPVEKACEAAVQDWDTLPNFVCDMRMTRRQPSKNTEKITAELRFWQGEEEVANLTIDGKRSEGIPDNGIWSRGEFSPAGLTVLDGRSQPKFIFRGEEKTPAGTSLLVFDYQIAKKANRTWLWNIPPYKYRPGFHGTLRIDKQSGQLRFVSLVGDDIDAYVPTLSASAKTDYAPVKIGDLGEYLLPAHSEVKSCYRFTPGCSEIVRDFVNCRKFAAKARIVE